MADATGARGAGLCDLSGLVAVVTGAAGGIGGGIATQFSRAGASVVIHYRTNRTAAEELRERLTADGGEATTVEAELTDEAAVRRLFGLATDRWGRVDALVNNAGIQPVEALGTMTADAWRQVIEVNATGTFLTTQVAAEVMGEHGGGSITHISSIEGTHPAIGHAHYCASKAAVIMHARAASVEYGPYGIRVNSVSPGLIDRDGLAEAWPDGVERYRHAAPLGRLGTNTDIGNACVFLASPMASWITGANLIVDGGVSNHPTW